MKWRLVITGEGPALNEPPADGDANQAALALVDALKNVPGQKITGATFQVDANNRNLLKELRPKKTPADADAPPPPEV